MTIGKENDMKTKKKLFAIPVALCAACLVGAAISTNAVGANAFSDYVDSDGTTHYGWEIIANETNAACWDFNEDSGMVSGTRAAEGDTSNQRVWNYAIRNLEIDSGDGFSLSATFTPDPDSDLSVERAYGLVPWYQDEDNYIIYWVQQKTGGNWSSQLYGRIAGSFRKYWIPSDYCVGSISTSDAWRNNEYEDMWYDCATHVNPLLLGQNSALLSAEMTLKVVSDIETITVNEKEVSSRYFELHQIVASSESGEATDKTIMKMYIKMDGDAGNFRTGLYSEAFSVAISNFSLEAKNTDFAGKVVSLFTDLPSQISSESDIQEVMDARTAYKQLLDLKSNVSSTDLSILENAETTSAAYVDDVIDGLDSSKATFKEDVNAAYELYSSLNEEIQAKVTKLQALIDAMNEAKNWSEPSESEPSGSGDVPSSAPAESVSDSDDGSSSSGGGCGGIIASSGAIMAGAMLLAAGGIYLIRRKKDK